uniref:WAP domain-containing protein n=1 Tax=Trichuris muris TaxID=70415 RepID=A0A5S6QYS6_TRIMR
MPDTTQMKIMNSAVLFASVFLTLLSVANAAWPIMGSMAVCPDNSPPIQHCPRGLCPTGYSCYQGWCCRDRRNTWNNNYNRPNPLYGTCPDGTNALQRCPRGRCPTGYFCQNGWCCRGTGGWNSGWNNNGLNPGWNSNINGWNSRWNTNTGGWRRPFVGGRCPQMFGPMLSNNHQCYSHNDCPAGRLCCNTMSGKRCLLPE